MKTRKFLSKLKLFFGTFKLNVDDNMQFDYFITFKKDTEFPLKILNQMGQWKRYGKKTVRGWSSLSKEDIKLFVIDQLNLNEDDFDVINANNDMFRIG